ncbi:MAG: hypothetical protein R3D52_06200 [Xanthobacteraceae bacterium]
MATYLTARTGDDFAPVYYCLIAAVPALIAVATMKETARKPLALNGGEGLFTVVER